MGAEAHKPASRVGGRSLRLFNYPAWKVDVNGRPTEAQTIAVTGQMMIPIPAGENQVQIRFARTGDRILGGFISLATVILLIAVLLFTRPLTTGAEAL